MIATGALAVAAGTYSIKLADKALDKASEKLVQYLPEATKSIKDKIVSEFRIGFQTFIQTSYERCRTYKTLLNPYVPLPVLDKYINVNIKIGEKIFTDTGVVNGIRNNTRIVITGLAGSGKSMFMKYMTLKIAQSESAMMPLFIELRRFNSDIERPIDELILQTLQTDTTKVSMEQFNLGLSAGAFALILDGFDELNEGVANHVESEIRKFEQFHPSTSIIVSSRPHHRFDSWEKFYVANVEPLDENQAIKLINSFDYDEGVKLRFVERVRELLWSSHQSFLSSPLLCTIMMLTYEEFAEIPTKMHAFYSQAFETLFQRHDALKSQFTREMQTALPKDVFKKCLAAFCATSYLDEAYTLSDDESRKYASAAIKYVRQSTGLALRNVSDVKLLNDLVHCVCILQPDGRDLSFVHRSFQEYFAAVFMTSYHDNRFPELMDRFARRYSDSAISMAFDMSREKIESEWLESRISNKIADLKSANSVSDLVKMTYGTLSISKGNDIFLFSDFSPDTFGFIFCLTKLYPRNFNMTTWFKPVDKEITLKFIIDNKIQAISDDGLLFDEWIKSNIGSQRSPRFTVEISDKDMWLKELHLDEPMNKFLEEAPKVLGMIERRKKMRTDVIDQFL